MMVGYATDHEGDCYEMLNMETNQILLSRDVQWLNRMYFNNNTTNEEENDEEDGEEGIVNEANDNEMAILPVAQQEAQPAIVQATATTRSGRAIRAPTRLLEEMEATAIDEVSEIMAVGAGIGGGFIHTSKLKPMKYDKAMAKDPIGWDKAVEKEHKRMKEHGVFKAVPRDQVLKGAKILTSTWAMKHKADGTLRARVTARGYEQKAEEHYEGTGVSSPVVNEASIFIILILIVMARMYAELNNAHGAFLEGLFSHGEKLHMKIPRGFEKFYPYDVALLLLKMLHGLKQAAFEHWKALLRAIRAIGMTRNKADPCVYFKWTNNGLMLWSSWVDDLLSCGNTHDVISGKETLKQCFHLDEVGELNEYVGCKVEHNKEEVG